MEYTCTYTIEDSVMVDLEQYEDEEPIKRVADEEAGQ